MIVLELKLAGILSENNFSSYPVKISDILWGFMANILILGGAGFRNSGDEALLRACVQVCRDFSPTSKLTLAANNLEVALSTLEGFAVDFTTSPRFAFFRGDGHYFTCDETFQDRWKKLRKALIVSNLHEARNSLVEDPELEFIDRQASLQFWDALEQSDAVVIHGGGILTSATRSRLWEQALTVELARRLGKRILLRSHQMGPFVDEIDRDRMRTILQHSCYVSSRDYQQSSHEISNISPKALVHDSVDDALTLRTDNRDTGTLQQHGLVSNGFICVGFRNGPAVGVTSQALKRTAEIITNAYEIFKIPVALLPQGPFDLDSLEELAKIINAPCAVVRPSNYLQDPMTIASQAALMIACPHHSLIFALRGAVPILSPASGNYYLFKNKGSMRFFELDDYVFDIDHDDFLEIATAKLQAILVEGDRLRHRIAFRVNELRMQAALANQDFARILLSQDL